SVAASACCAARTCPPAKSSLTMRSGRRRSRRTDVPARVSWGAPMFGRDYLPASATPILGNGVPAMTREDVIAALQSNLHKIVDATKGMEIDETKSMKDYGADSLEIVEVVSRTMKQLNVK